MNSGLVAFEKLGRKHPAQGVLVSANRPTMVFLTVCTKGCQQWLNRPAVHQALRETWSDSRAWLVGDYLLMPDHLHLFCAPHDLSFSLQRWVTHWKRQFSCLRIPNTGDWLRNSWDTRLRTGENYTAKWRYVQENPVRAGLVNSVENWPFQGQLNVLRW
jgi:putative transposase